MTTNYTELSREKERQLLEKYFGSLASEAARMPEEIGAYTLDLPQRIEDEYFEYLKELWGKFASDNNIDSPLVLEEVKLREVMTDGIFRDLTAAYALAKERTLWERLTGSNHTDVAHYKSLLKAYTQERLNLMRLDFLEEITGHHITGKAFDD